MVFRVAKGNIITIIEDFDVDLEKKVLQIDFFFIKKKIKKEKKSIFFIIFIGKYHQFLWNRVIRLCESFGAVNRYLKN